MRNLLYLLAVIPASTAISNHISCFNMPITPVIKTSSDQEKCLAVMIYGEARGEQESGQVAVAYTALNRATKKTLCQVVLQPKQYSIFNDNPALKAAALSTHLQPKQKNIIDQKSWNQAVRVARVVTQKLVQDPTNGATHYLAPSLMKVKGYRYPKWSKQYEMVAVIDNHKFYKKV